ncbi:MAG: SH3 domain-containing protein [Anaerolineae bacterium]|nr:SH3 domain-containing protein [Anaerolineae bacterium]
MGLPNTSLSEDKLYVTPTNKYGIIVRDGPGNQYNHIASAFIGDALEVLEEEKQALSKIGQRGTWLNIRTQDRVDGWVSARYVQRVHVGTGGETDIPIVTPSTKPLYLHTTAQDGLYVRSGPGSQFRALTTIMPSQRLEPLSDPAEVKDKLGRYGEWIQIKTSQEITGWSAAWYLEEIIEPYVWPLGHALAGLHGPAEPWSNRWDGQAYQIVQQARIEAIKLLASGALLAEGPGAVTDIVNRLRTLGVRFIMARLLDTFSHPKDPEDFVETVLPAARCLFENGVKYFEVHNEPNLHTDRSPEGMWIAWQNGREFGAFFERAVELLRQELPQAYFGFPGLSSGFDIPKVRTNSDRFLAEADEAIRNSSDFICMHTYWGIGGTNYLNSIREIKQFCDKYYSKLVFVTEFNNGGARIGKDIKGREYALFYTEAKKLPSNLGALFSFVLSAARGDFPDEVWVNSPIARYVGERPIV